MSNPRFPLHLPVEERKALRMAAAAADMTMTDFIRAAIAEKIARQRMEQTAPAPNALRAPNAEHSASGALAEADEKPA
jgi:hypothetical protein